MYSHITLGGSDIERSRDFYDAALRPLGIALCFSGDGYAAYGTGERPQFWIVFPFDGGPASVGNGTHVAFLAPDRAAVDAFHSAALEHGGSDEGAPGLRPHYHEHYYGAYVRDPDGNKLQAACHHPE